MLEIQRTGLAWLGWQCFAEVCAVGLRCVQIVERIGMVSFHFLVWRICVPVEEGIEELGFDEPLWWWFLFNGAQIVVSFQRSFQSCTVMGGDGFRPYVSHYIVFL